MYYLNKIYIHFYVYLIIASIIPLSLFLMVQLNIILLFYLFYLLILLFCFFRIRKKKNLTIFPFYKVFPEIAKNETFSLKTIDNNGISESYIFYELYCIEPSCNCLHSILYVFYSSANNFYHLATLRISLKDEPHSVIFSKHEDSQKILNLFNKMYLHAKYNNKTERDTLIKHYNLMKNVLKTSSKIKILFNFFW